MLRFSRLGALALPILGVAVMACGDSNTVAGGQGQGDDQTPQGDTKPGDAQGQVDGKVPPKGARAGVAALVSGGTVAKSSKYQMVFSVGAGPATPKSESTQKTLRAGIQGAAGGAQ